MSTQVHLVEAPAWPAAETPLLAGSRRASWRFELLDRSDRSLGPLRTCTGFDVEVNVNATVRASGGLTYTGPAIDWTRHRIRVYYGATARGQAEEWPVGTFIVEAPEETLGGMSPGSVDLDLLDASYRLDLLVSSASPWTAHKGANIVEVVRGLLDRQNVRHSIEDSEEALSSSMSWKPGTPYRRIINDLLDAANFFAAWADPMGVIRSERRVPPAQRGERYVFAYNRGGDELMTVPEFVRRRDLAVPNRVYLIAESDDPDALPMVGTATDTSGGPFSWTTTGVVRTHQEENVPAGSQEALDARAAQRLQELQRVSSVFEFETLPVPLDGNDVLRLRRPDEGVDARVVAEKFRISQGQPTMPITAREVTT